MNTTQQAGVPDTVGGTEGLLISADSHVIEPSDLWVTRLPKAFRDRAPRFPERSGLQFHPRLDGHTEELYEDTS